MQRASAAALCCCIQAARQMAALLPTCAVRDMLLMSPHTSSGSSSSSSSKLTAILWDQIEQSGILQQLPQALKCSVDAVQTPLKADQFASSTFLTDETLKMLQLVYGLQQLQPNFLTTHAAGKQSVVPAMQLGLSVDVLLSVVELPAV